MRSAVAAGTKRSRTALDALRIDHGTSQRSSAPSSPLPQITGEEAGASSITVTLL